MATNLKALITAPMAQKPSTNGCTDHIGKLRLPELPQDLLEIANLSGGDDDDQLVGKYNVLDGLYGAAL